MLAAAITEFARSGYTGTSTEAIAARAGISQPYLFRLFGTKKDLFVATYDLVASRIINELTRAGEGLEGEEAKKAMGAAYLELMQDPEMLQVQLHGFAAAPADPDIARSCRRTFEVLAGVFYQRTHLSDQDLLELLRHGDADQRDVRHRSRVLSERVGAGPVPDARESKRHQSRKSGAGRPPPWRPGPQSGGNRMSEPVTGAFFLDRVDSDQSQTRRGRARPDGAGTAGAGRAGPTPPRGR